MLSTTPRWAAVVAAFAVVAGCSSSSPTSTMPGQAGPGLPGAAAPTPKSNEADEKLTIKGRVLDARTGDALAKATVVVYQTEDIGPAVGAAEPPTGPAGATDSASASIAAPATADTQPKATSKPKSTRKLKDPVKATADDKGNFEVKDLPPGTYAVTAHHKGYVAVSYVGGRPASGRLTLALSPQGDEAGGYEASGKVFLISKKPAAGVMVGAALPPGLFAGAPAVSDADGGFTLTDLPSGKVLVAAWTTGDVGQIKTWGVQKGVKIAEGKDRKSSSPQITLRAVSKPIVIAGKVSSAYKGIKPRQVQVLLATDEGAEISLLSRTPDQDGYFRFSLPAPEEDTTYHLIASGVDSRGSATYSHIHKISGPSHAFDLTLPELPATPSVDTRTTPEWSWSAAPDVSAYRVRLETTGDDGKTLWEGWTTGTSVMLPQISGLALKHGEAYRFTLSSIKTQGAFELSEVATTPWAGAASLAPKEFVAGEAMKEEEAPRHRPATLKEETGGARHAPAGGPAVPDAGPGAVPPAPPGGPGVAPAPGKLPAPPSIPGVRPGGKVPKAPVPKPTRSPLRQTGNREVGNRT